MFQRSAFAACAVLVAVIGVGCSDDDDDNMMMEPEDTATAFTLTVHNRTNGVVASGGVATPFAPGVWAVGSSGDVLFDQGSMDKGEGLEALAEDGSPDMLSSALSGKSAVDSHGTFGPIGPGEMATVDFEAEPGDYLTFATMFVQSNDLFVSPAEMGIDLFDGDVPMTGEITSMLMLMDAGTEINEEPGVGMYQAPRQGGANMGPTEGVVQPVNDGWTYPANSDVLMATIQSESMGGGARFMVRVENMSNSESPYPLAPGAFASFTGSNPFFTDGSADRGMGLEGVAEDGTNSMLAANLPGVSGVVSSGAFGDGPIGPGGVYEFTFDAMPGEQLGFATMFVQSNDLFYAPAAGMELFPGGNPIGEGAAMDITDQLGLWDAGTEINEEPGVGMYQAPRQAAPNSGPAEGLVQPVMDGYVYGSMGELLHVTLSLR